MELKKILMLFFVAVLPMTFMACSDDDNDEEEFKITLAELKGEWEITQFGSFPISVITGFLGEDLIITITDNRFAFGELGEADFTLNDNKIKTEFMGIPVEIDIISLRNNELTLSLELKDTELGGGMLNGTHKVVCKKIK